MKSQTVRLTDCCERQETRHSREIEGRLYCDRACYVREAHAKWDKAPMKQVILRDNVIQMNKKVKQ